MKKRILKNIRNNIIAAVSFGLPIVLIVLFAKDLKNIEQHSPRRGYEKFGLIFGSKSALVYCAPCP